MDPRGTVALVTGGARVGVTVAEELARRGCDVALTFRHSRRAAGEAARRVRAAGRRALLVRADLSRRGAAAAVVRTVRGRLGRLDILVGMASIYRRVAAARLDERVLRKSLDVDLRSLYLLALRAAPLMRAGGKGRIVALADWLPASGRPRYRGYLPYYVAKAAMIGLVEALALELAPDILVNAIAPGPILKPAGFSARAERAVRKATPLGRWGGPVEVARSVLFLIETEFVTGECLRFDGGRHLF